MTVRRQQSLFAAEDWKVAYKAFRKINFQAYDFDTMRSAMVEYVKTNFPENFNDYIESSEFIAIIELLAYLSQSLAFRMDVNTRENFLETAERRDSVFKLARMLGYNPKRNIPASGLLKITSVRTTEPLVDSLGNELNNRTIYWDDSNNNQSYEQFLMIMNAAMSRTNRFTAPIKTGTIGGISTELYQLNTPLQSPMVYNVSISVNGVARPFTVVNPDFTDNSHFFERHPDPTNLFNLIYRNDGKGLSSKDTGFFTMFRQGTLQFVDFNYTAPLENRLEDVAVQNIGENDVYLQEIDSSGLVLSKWERIPNTVGQTLNYNSSSLSTRNLYAVENRGLDGIRLRFTDGNFGTVPVGIFRLWHRVSDPSRYVIQPQDARNLSITIPYENNQGRRHALTVNMSLQYAVGNSLPAESVESIKERAPQVFYTQNRMVSAQDYNVFPQSQSRNIVKLKATNRTHAGHSRYIDINDPTGTYHNVDTFADDAFLYSDIKNSTTQIIINNSTTPVEVVTSILPNLLKGQNINNFAYYTARNVWGDEQFRYNIEDQIRWNPLPVRSIGSTGFFTEIFSTGTINVLLNVVSQTRRLRENNVIKLINPEDNSEFKWVRVVGVENGGQLSAGINTARGPWSLSDDVPSNWILQDVIVSLRKLFNVPEAASIEQLIRDKQTFALGYDFVADAWYTIPGSALSTAVKTGAYAINANNRGPNSWLVIMEYKPTDRYYVTVRGQEYVVQSKNDLKFYNVKDVKVVDSSNKSSQDTVIFSTVNVKPTETEVFEWTGLAWRNRDLGTLHEPQGVRVNLPLKTRDTTWRDVQVNWRSNFGILFRQGFTLADYAENDRFVNEATVALGTFFRSSTLGITSDGNVVIPNNLGLITTLPNRFKIAFGPFTFGSNIVDETATPFIAYKQLPSGFVPGGEVIFKAEVGQPAISYGTDGATPDPSVLGRLNFIEYDPVTQTGVLEYINIQNNTLHSSADSTNIVSRDKLQVIYVNNKDKLDQPVEWQVVDVFREQDGFVDPRKVVVAPVDLDQDMVPDRPRQFAEYVGPIDLVLFEKYTDFDGYTYDRPVLGNILDYRAEEFLTFNSLRVSPGSFNEPILLEDVDWILVRSLSVAQPLESVQNSKGIVVYVEDEDRTYQFVPISTSNNLSEVRLLETADFFAKRGRGQTQNLLAANPSDGIIRWKHVAPNDVRIDPSISNVVEMIILTASYYDQVTRWQARPEGEFPLEPTSNELTVEFQDLNQYKSASDTLTFRSAKFKLLFGPQAPAETQAKFRVVKLSDQLSDNELKTRIISVMNEYFDVRNWEFGETFYFTELSTFIHQRLGSAIGSIVILPRNLGGCFGELFQVKAEPNELFISTAGVADIEIISRLDSQTLRVDR